MAETEVSITTEDTKVPGKIVAAGIPTRLEVNIPREKAGEENNGSVDAGAMGEGDDATKAAAKIEADKLAAAEAAKNTPPVNELTDDQLKAYFEKQGIQFEGIDKLKEKLTAPVTAPTLTDEEKAKIETEKKNRIVNEHLSRGGKVEQFAIYESIIAADKPKLGLQKEIEDLVAMGIPQEEATELANERYFQLTDEQIEGIEDKDAKAKAIKQREIGLKKLENKGAYVQNTAKSYLDILSKDLAERDAEKIKMEQHTSKVEDAIKKYQRNSPTHSFC